jgi:hypothetical protein
MNEPKRRRWKWVVVSVAIGVVIVAALIYFRGQLAIDSCLDAGGRWDYERNLCDQIVDGR